MSNLKLDVPSSWIITSLPDIAAINMGQSPSSSDVNEHGDGLVFFQGKAEFGKLYPTPRKYCTRPTKIASEGDVLLSIRAPVGPTNIATETTAIGRGLAAISAHNGLTHPKYLLYYFRNLEPWLSTQGTGSTFKAISGQFIKELIAPLPSFTEQKIIAEKLDTLLAQVDSTKARLEQIPKILKRFRQAVLASAVRGKLTDDWLSSSNLVDTESLLKEIEIERDKAKDNRLIKPSFGKKKNISPLFEIPSDSWGWVGFEQICATNNNALKAGPFGSALKKADCVEDGYKVYGQEQVISGSESLETYRINDEKYDQLKSCTVGPGDILVSLVGTIGKVMVLSSQAEIGIINPRLVKITLHEKVNPKYIKIYLDSPISHGFFKGFSHGGTMDILNLGILKELPITLPPKEEQAEIVRRVEQLFAYADTIEKQVNNALARVNNLTQSILAKAFRGELTAQWRAENPELISGENSAAALLEKIKAERAASTGKKASRKKS